MDKLDQSLETNPMSQAMDCAVAQRMVPTVNKKMAKSNNRRLKVSAGFEIVGSQANRQCLPAPDVTETAIQR